MYLFLNCWLRWVIAARGLSLFAERGLLFAAASHCSGFSCWLLPWWLRWWSVCLQCRRPGFSPWVGKILWRRKWQPNPVFLPGKVQGQRSLVGYSPWGNKELDTTEQLHFHFLLLLSTGSRQTCFRSCSVRAQQLWQALFLWGRWDLPRPGIEPVSTVLAGRFLTTGTQGKSSKRF